MKFSDRDVEKQDQDGEADPSSRPLHDLEDEEIERGEPRRSTTSRHEPVGAQLQKTTSAREAVLAPTRSRRSAAAIDPGPPPDGGVVAWTQVALVHLTIFNTWGLITSYGVFQTYYSESIGASSSDISWLGSVQIFLLFGIGAFSGRALDAGFFHHVYIAGAVLQLVGVFTTAQATEYWQLFLAQALCLGIGNGLQFTPSMGLVSTYFAKNRAFAFGVGTLGSCTGGVVFPLVVQQMIPTAGFAWTMRTIGFIMAAINIITISLYRTRLPPRRSGPLVEWAAFKEAPFSLLCAGMFMNFWGLYFAFFYVGAYGRNNLGLTYQDSINLLITTVSVGFIFRVLPNYVADILGPLNCITPFAFFASIMMFVWIAISDRSSLFVFATFYGIGAAGMQSLWPATLASMTTDLSRAGTRTGMGFSIVAFASLTGAPLGGALVEKGGGDYLYAQIWGGASFFLGGMLLLATRFAKVGWDFKRRI